MGKVECVLSWIELKAERQRVQLVVVRSAVLVLPVGDVDASSTPSWQVFVVRCKDCLIEIVALAVKHQHPQALFVQAPILEQIKDVETNSRFDLKVRFDPEEEPLGMSNRIHVVLKH